VTRRYNQRLAHLHRTYTALEICSLFSVCMSTVRRWHARGLTPIDGKRPFLYSGAELRAFIERHNPKRCPLMPGEIYCVACKAPKIPKGKRAVVIRRDRTRSVLAGECSGCGRRIRQWVSSSELVFRAGDLTIEDEDDEGTVSSDGERLEVTLSAEVGS
jgi:RNase P subunit RPR2